jgi:hypothetical protein
MTDIELNELFNKGNQHYFNKEFVEASLCYMELLKYVPDNHVIHHNLGLAYIGLEQYEKSLNCFELPLSKGYTDSYLSRGSALRSLGKYEGALADFCKLVTLDPTSADAYSNIGNTLREFGMPVAALPFLEKALESQPDNPTFKLNESVAHLLNGDLENGWKNYDARWYYQSDVSFKPNLPGVEYDGTQDVAGKIVLVYGEQGFGDNIQFVRFIKILQERGATITMVVRPQLVGLFECNFPNVKIKTDFSSLEYHYHCPMMELPKCLGITIKSIPYNNRYLTAPLTPDVKLPTTKKKRVGIQWGSNGVAFITRFRKMELATLLGIARDDIEIYCLGFEPNEEEVELLKNYKVKTPDLGDFCKTASIISQLDLVITVDTVTAHLAGALGVETWVMLSQYGCDWRWFLNRTDSPFYENMRLFRQTDNTWDSVIDQIKLALDTK